MKLIDHKRGGATAAHKSEYLFFLTFLGVFLRAVLGMYVFAVFLQGSPILGTWTPSISADSLAILGNNPSKQLQIKSKIVGLSTKRRFLYSTKRHPNLYCVLTDLGSRIGIFEMWIFYKLKTLIL